MTPAATRRTGAALFVVAGLLGALILWILAAQRYDDGVRSLARAPVGCDTTLDFAERGPYFVFVETRGEFPEVRGDCELEGAFDLGDAPAPPVEVRLVDPAGDDVPLQSFRGREDYDRAGSSGVSLARLTIDEPGDHVVRVTSTSDTAFAVAVGRDPADGVANLRLVGVAVGLLGAGIALVILVTGRRSSPPPPPPAPTGVVLPWSDPAPTGPPPMAPPTGPPTWAPPPPPAPPPGPPGPPGQ